MIILSDLLMLLSEPSVNQVFIEAKIGEESELILHPLMNQ